MQAKRIMQLHLFQSTLPREERQENKKISIGSSEHFNPRSHERSDSGGVQSYGIGTHFNPRSHERSDSDEEAEITMYGISIHAPTRGATELGEVQKIHGTISIHAPTRGATFHGTRSPAHTRGFQSTLPREERRDISTAVDASRYFNPRSHERSDADLPVFTPEQLRFQSTLPREERRCGWCRRRLSSEFQSTLPREERPRLVAWASAATDFNPRSHERSDSLFGVV